MSYSGGSPSRCSGSIGEYCLTVQTVPRPSHCSQTKLLPCPSLPMNGSPLQAGQRISTMRDIIGYLLNLVTLTFPLPEQSRQMTPPDDFPPQVGQVWMTFPSFCC
jgi:hypothetical protein